jgi:DNA-binding transcriptional LysR family regulator
MEQSKASPALHLHYESDMAEVVKKLVLEGEGVAWLPKSSIAAELELRVYRDMTNRSELLDTLWRHLRASSGLTE